MSEDEVLTRLKRIEDKLDRSETKTRRLWFFALGFGGMIASLAVLPLNVWGAVAVFVLGYLLMVLSPYLKKS